MAQESWLEITTVVGCTVRCRYCPQALLVDRYARTTRPAIMSFAVFRTCLDKLPAGVAVHFSGMAEPWLNPQATDMLLYAAARGHRLSVYTTLTGMTRDDFDRISHLAFATFTVHLPDNEGNARIAVTPAYLDLLRHITEHYRGSPHGAAYGASCHGTLHPAVTAALGESAFGAHNQGMVQWLEDRSGHVAVPGVEPVRHAGAVTCARSAALAANILLPDGEVVLCCHDYGMEHVLGSLLTGTYDELFTGEAMRRVRRRMADGTRASLCHRCVFARPVPAGAAAESAPAARAAVTAGAPPRAPGLILMYHRVADADGDPWSLAVSPQHFAAHLDIVRRAAAPLMLREAFGGAPPAGTTPWVAITFDDGYADNLYLAAGLLKQRQLPATFFLASGCLGADRFWWDELADLLFRPGTLTPLPACGPDGRTALPAWPAAHTLTADDCRRLRQWRVEDADPTPRHALYRALHRLLLPLAEAERRQLLDWLRTWAGMPPPPAARPLTLAEAAGLAREPLFEIGAHTVHHDDLAARPAAEQAPAIGDCREFLETRLRCAVTGFSYPYGSAAPESAARVRAAGYRYAVTTRAGSVTAAGDRFLLPRLAVENWPGEHFTRQLDHWLADAAAGRA